MKHGFALAATFAAALSVESAGATPTLWQRAKDPERAREYTALVRLERYLFEQEDDGPRPEPALLPQYSARALMLLAIWHIDLDAVQDPRLCFLLARTVFNLQPGTPDADVALSTLLPRRRPLDPLHEAKRLLERALAGAPSSPLAAEGEFNLALIEGRLGNHAGERTAYLRSIALDSGSGERAVSYLNLAESDMHAGDLKTAIREYRVAVTSAGERQDIIALAYYGLAVALDRSGDLPRALSVAAQANRIQLAPGVYAAQNALDLPGNSYSPPYEAHYYKALAAMAAAQTAADHEARRDELANAIEHWEAYLVLAEADQAPWVQNARLREARARRELAALAGP